jgi:hypothetical protein
VVAVAVGAARAARERSQRLRDDSLDLRVAAEQNLRLATVGKERAEVAAVRARRVASVASPWSSLDWRPAEDELGHVLVLVD